VAADIVRHVSAQRRHASAQRIIWASSGMDIHASAHMSQARAHIAHISAARGERRIIMSAHMRVISAQSMTARMTCIWAWPPICMQELMVSSHVLWQAMQAWTQSCISLLMGTAVAGC
jgi:hypothetical protein